LLMPPGLNKGRNQIFSGILVESHCESLTLHDPRQASNLQFVTKEKCHFTIF
jgi:hypothetical protein